MKLLVLADIHQRDFKWSKLAKAVKKEKPDITCVAGDLVANSFAFQYEKFTQDYIRKYAEKIKEFCPYLILIPGNDDNGELSDLLLNIDGSDDLWYNVHDRVLEIEGLEFVGIPYVLDHPFGYKYWSVRENDEDLRICTVQRFKPLTSKAGVYHYIPIGDYYEFFMNRPSMKTILEDMSKKVKDMSKVVFLMHCPPMGCGLDIAGSGDACGSGSITKFIMDKQPLLTVHGHIHESPFYTHKWCCNLDKSWAIQAGQMNNDLYYVIVEIQDGKIVRLEHSIYGEVKI